jgi:uncharacterized protein (TIGR03435 family)
VGNVRKLVPALAVALTVSAVAHGQAFEVASVRQATEPSGERAGQPRISAGPDRLTARDATLLDCIEWAWNVREYQVAGPDWIRTERFEIAAKADRPGTPAAMRPMLQALLAERFGLILHRENRVMPALALVVAKSGPKLARSVAAGEGNWKRIGPGLKLEFQHQKMADLAGFLSTLAVVDRPVVDDTGLAGAYTFTLDLNEAVRGGDAAAPGVPTLLQEQLGLRLDGRRMPLEVLVVDRVERLR